MAFCTSVFDAMAIIKRILQVPSSQYNESTSQKILSPEAKARGPRRGQDYSKRVYSDCIWDYR